jgi:NAD(P)-dependent dehydrogenase (short-subunit alcohol dehydrogenase family)
MNDLFSLSGKVAVIPGGGGVLPGAIAEGFAAAGAGVALVDINLANAAQRAHALSPDGTKAIAIQADVSRKPDLEAALQTTLAHFGRVDILVNGAGINSSTPFFEISGEEWDRILSVNLRSIFLACQVFGKAMIEAGRGGSIINISSIASGPPLSKVFTYDISKGGVNQLTQFLAREFAPHKIRVNALLPGFFPAEQNRKILTEERIAQIMNHTPMARFGEPKELMGAALFLAAEAASSFVTGTLLTVDGGFNATTI